jgi:hypothetical protein
MRAYDRRAWQLAIMAGFIVDGAVAALLSLLIYRVQRIDLRAAQVRDSLRAAEANTAEAALIPQVADAIDDVLAEGLQHHLFLGRVLEKVKK